MGFTAIALLAALANVGSEADLTDISSSWSAPPLIDASMEEVLSDSPTVPVAEISGAEEASVVPDATHWGVLLDAGLPDGAGASVVFRPWHWLRFHVGATTAGFTTGIRGGVALVPFNFWITPSLNLDGGYLPPGDANGIAQTVSGNPDFQSASLRDVSYGFANAQLGLELGPPRRFTFYLRGGISYVEGTLGGVAAALAGSDPTVSSSNPVVRLTLPSAKLGFIVYFL